MVMRTMRRQFKYLKYLIYALIVVFIGSFAYSCGRGGGGKTAENPYAPAVVNSVPLSDRVFNHLVQNRMEQLRAQYGSEVPAQAAAKARQETLDAMIDEELLKQAAVTMKLKVTDGELAADLVSIPAFRGQDGRFNQQAYLEYLNRQAQDGVSQDQAEENFRVSILVNKIYLLWRDNVLLSEAEIKEGLDKLHREVRASCIVMLYKPFQDKAHFTEDRLKDYYAQKRSSWETPEQIKARHILVNLAKGASPADEAAAKAKADALYKQIKAGADFAELAKKNSDDPGSAKRGGDLGFFSKGSMVPEFEKAAFALKKGEVSEPVKSPFGFHIIKMEESKAAFKPTFENSRKKALTELSLAEARTKVDQLSAQALAGLQAGLSMDDTARGLTLTVKTTAWFKRGDKSALPELGKDAQFARAMLNLDQGQVPQEAVKEEKGAVVAMVAEEKAGPEPDDEDVLKQERQEVEAQVQGQKAESLEKAWLKKLKSEAKITTNLAQYEKE